METILEGIAYIHNMHLNNDKIISYIENINKKKNTLLRIDNRPHLTMNLSFLDNENDIEEETYIKDLIINEVHPLVYEQLNKIGINNLAPRQRFAPSKLMPGMGCEIHIDGPKEFAYQIYLNDNFEGGETFYPEENLYIKPRPGHLVIFKSSLPHGVTTVEKNPRYTITSNFGLNTKNLKYVPSPIDDEWEEVDEYIGES